MTILFFHFFRKPIVRLSFTFLSNLNMKKYMGLSFGMAFICMLMLFARMPDSKMLFLGRTDFFHRQYFRLDRVQPEVYEDKMTAEDGRILTAVLESDRIKGKYMKVFVPVLNPEEIMVDIICGKYKRDEKMTQGEHWDASAQFWLDCYKKYHRFYLNDQLVDADIIKHNHPNKGEDGVLAYIKTENLNEGMNILKIEKLKKESEAFRTMRIPFWFEYK